VIKVTMEDLITGLYHSCNQMLNHRVVLGLSKISTYHFDALSPHALRISIDAATINKVTEKMYEK
jgi:hypothetical protein